MSLPMQITEKIVKLLFAIPFLKNFADFIILCLCSCLRFGAGGYVARNTSKCRRPTQPLKLFEFEGCPFCKKVREALCTLDLDYECYPCPRETLKRYGVCVESRYRPEVNKRGGRMMMPFLVDPNTKKEMYDSDAIVSYLWSTYGAQASIPFYLSTINSFFLKRTLTTNTLLRPLPYMGMLRTPSKYTVDKDKLLELWGCEASPGSKRVREILCTLELPYLHHSVPYGTSKTGDERIQRITNGQANFFRPLAVIFDMPVLFDPNTGSEVKGSLPIVDYLLKTYKNGETVNECWADYSTKGATDDHGALFNKKKEKE